MDDTGRRAATIGLLLCLAALMLGALPALGWRLDGARQPTGREAVLGDRAHGTVFSTRVRISGQVQIPLSPGVGSPISITFHNHNPRAVTMQRVRVKIGRISAPHADATHRCTRLDFEIRQMRKRTLRIPAGRSTDLAGLGLPVRSWPTLSMRNRPLNQDGCKDARLTLRFRAHRLGAQ